MPSLRSKRAARRRAAARSIRAWVSESSIPCPPKQVEPAKQIEPDHSGCSRPAKGLGGGPGWRTGGRRPRLRRGGERREGRSRGGGGLAAAGRGGGEHHTTRGW